MMLTLDLWQMISLLLAFFGTVAGFGKILLVEFEKRLDDRFEAQDDAREEGQKALRQKFAEHISEERRNADALQSLERDFLRWQADLPISYVRREDYVRGQVVIEAKLDNLYNKLEVIQLRGSINA